MHLDLSGAAYRRAMPALVVVMTLVAFLSITDLLPVHLYWGHQPGRDYTMRLATLVADPPPPEAVDIDEEFVLPMGWKPSRAPVCMLDPDYDLDPNHNPILNHAGGIGGMGNARQTSQDCWAHCKSQPRCVSWFWCDQREGCEDFDRKKYPYKGCELRTQEVVRTLGQPPDDPDYRPATHASGYMKPLLPRDQIGAFTINEAGNKLPWKADKGLIVTTGIHPKPCQRKGGDMIHKLSIHNKLDYVRLHGYEFHLFTHVVDKSLPKLYTKIGIIRHLLDETTPERAEWILWIDADTIIEELAFQLPYHLYDHHKINFVTWGVKDMLLRGDQRHGVNTGIMLVRNVEDSNVFWEDVAYVSRININAASSNATEEGRIKAELEDQIQISSSFDDLQDQNVIVYLLRVKWDKYMPQTMFDGRYCISCWFKDIEKYQAHAPFVNHFAACQMCTAVIPSGAGQDEKQQWLDYCHSEFMTAYDYANRTMLMLLGCQQEMVQWGPPLGQPPNEWYDCSDKRGQPTCPPLPPPPQPPPPPLWHVYPRTPKQPPSLPQPARKQGKAKQPAKKKGS